jgi:hypothetical protein
VISCHVAQCINGRKIGDRQRCPVQARCR